jgi:thymidine kinase
MPKSIIKGKLEVICGSMFSGKTEELIRRIRRAEIAQQKLCVFKHRIDDRMSIDFIHAHSGDKFKAIALENPLDMQLFITEDIRVVAIDEVQFFSPDIIPTILEFVEMGKRVIAAGLDLDFRGLPFGPIPTLLAVANTISKLNAVCMSCGNDAHFSQRLINGRAAKFDDPILLIGAQDRYQARCRDCYIIDKNDWKSYATQQGV